MVTVLFADLVDSTGLAQRLDPERAREILGQFFEAASEELLALRGRAEKFIGDAVMAVFGLPTVHEDDALRAVRAGLAIRAPDPPPERGARPARAPRRPRRGRVGRGRHRSRAGRSAPRHRAGRERRCPTPGRRRTRRGARRRDHRRAHRERRLLRRPAPGHREGLRRRHDRRLPRRGAHAAERPPDDPVRRAFERARDPAREPAPRHRHRTSGARQRPRRIGHREVAPGRRARRASSTTTSPCSPAARGRSPTRRRSRRPRRSWPSSPGSRRTTRPRRPGAGCASSPSASRRPRRRQPSVVERLALLFGMAERPSQASFVQDVQAGFVALVDGLARDTPVGPRVRGRARAPPAMLELIERLGSPDPQGHRKALVLALARTTLLDDRPAWGTTTENAVRLRLEPLSPDESIDLARQASGRRIDDDRGGRDRRARRRQPLLHHRDDRHAAPRPRRPARGRAAREPAAHRAGRRRGPARPPRPPAARAHPARVVVLRLVRPARAPDDRPRGHRGRAPAARGGRDPRARGRRATRSRAGASGTRR